MRPSPRQGFVVPTNIIRVHTVPQLIMHVTPKGSNREYLVASIPNKADYSHSITLARCYAHTTPTYAVLSRSSDSTMPVAKFYQLSMCAV